LLQIQIRSENKTNTSRLRALGRKWFVLKILWEITFVLRHPTKKKNCCWRPQYVSDGYNTWLLFLWCDINRIHKCVNSYVSRLDTTDGKEQILIGLRHTPPFFRRCGHPRTHTQVSEDYKTPINLPSNIILQITWCEGANWKIRSSALQEICTWRQEKFVRAKGTLILF